MREYICRNCGYRTIEKDIFDHINSIPMYPNFMVNNVIPYINASMYDEGRIKCSECGSRYEQ